MAKISTRVNSATAYEARNANPMLAKGEPFYELDTGGLKVGNGEQRYNDLRYAGMIQPDVRLVSPNGTVYRLLVSNTGTLTTEVVT